MGKFKIIVIVLVSLWLASYLIAHLVDTEIGDKIAIIPIKGSIVTTMAPTIFQQGTIGPDEIIPLLKAAEKNENVKGIVLEINSPGGAVLASKEIVEAVKGMEKPVVAWIRDIGTSGAYWVASASDVIVADELSLTGSISVVAAYLEFSELFEEYGVTYESLKTGKYKDIGSPFKKLTDEERALLLKKMDIVHEAFVTDVSENRNLEKEVVDDLATGIYYLGQEAYDLGLVDRLGGKELAMNLTKELANITEAGVLKLEKKSGFFEVFNKLSTDSFYFMGRGIGKELEVFDAETTPRLLT